MSAPDQSRLALSNVRVLIVHDNQTELDILSQICVGFSVKSIRKSPTPAEADEAVGRETFDLIIVDGDMRAGSACDFIARVRRLEDNPNRTAPMLLIAGHTPSGTVARARDCGANFVIAKPIMPQILFERIVWLAREPRQFVESENYVGPDRRHKAFGPPPGEKGRRHDDLSTELGEATGPDLCQTAIDALFAPKRAAV